MGGGRRTHGNVAKTGSTRLAVQMARSAGGGDTNTFVISPCDPVTSQLSLFKHREGDCAIANQPERAAFLKSPNTIYGVLRTSLMHLRRRARAT
jgi:hypothetical protein